MDELRLALITAVSTKRAVQPALCAGKSKSRHVLSRIRIGTESALYLCAQAKTGTSYIESFMSKKKENRPTNRFWLLLVGSNVLAMFYPVSLFQNATSGDGQLFASLLLISIMFVVAILDTVSIVFAYLL